MSKIDYKQAGVDYGKIDPLKILAQQAAAATAGNLRRHGLQEVAASRGESAYVVDCGDFYLASITECLGTKALVADATRADHRQAPTTNSIAQDTLGDGDQRPDHRRCDAGLRARLLGGRRQRAGSRTRSARSDLVDGWRAACDRMLACPWGGGETPALAGVVVDDRIDLAASCVGPRAAEDAADAR